MIINIKSQIYDEIIANFNADDFIFDKMIIEYDINFNQLKFSFINKQSTIMSCVYLLSHFLNENKLTMIGYKDYAGDVSKIIKNELLLSRIRKTLLRIIKYDSVL